MKTVPFDDALSLVLASAASVSPMPAVRVPLVFARGLRLAEDVVSPRAHPPRDDSAMDGYAVRTSDLVGAARGREISLPLASGVCAPGLRSIPFLPAGHTMRILTGGPVPDGADAVVRQEATHVSATHVVFWSETRAAENIRRAGEDLASGALVLAGASGGAPLVLGPPEITALAALGIAHPLVVPRPRACLLTTGDELRSPGEALAPGEIYDSNGAGLFAALEDSGAIVASFARARDDAGAQHAALAAGIADADVVVTAGGISVGDRDHVADVLSALGTEWKLRGVRMKPGHPFSFGVRARGGAAAQLVFGLPGNPAAAQMSFELFVRPALRLLAGLAVAPPERAARPARLAAPITKRGGSTYFARGRAEARGGDVTFTPSDRQGAGMITSMIGYDAVARLAPDATEIVAGSRVEIVPRAGAVVRERPGPAVVAFVGRSGAGKTTLLEAVVLRLAERGLRVAVLKHAHHGFALDPEDKDTARLARAGARSTAVLSPDGAAIVTDADDSAFLRAVLHGEGDVFEAALDARLALLFPAADLVLLEGFHAAPCRKIVVVDDRGPEPRDLAATHVIASVGGVLPGVPRRLSRDDLPRLVDFVQELTRVADGG